LRRLGAVAVLLLALGEGCDDLTVAGEFDPRLAAAGTWPASLAVLDSTRLTVEVTDASGNPLQGLPIRWEVEDSARLTVRADTATGGLEAVIVARRAGASTVRARIEGFGLTATEHTASVTTVAPVFTPVDTAWTGRVLTRTQSDTIEVEIVKPDGSAIMGLPIEWRSSDPEILGVTQLAISESDTTAALRERAGRRAHIQARRGGTAEIIAAVTVTGFESLSARFPVAVDSVVATATLPDTLTVADTLVVGLALAATDGSALDLPVRWESSDPSRLAVRNVSTDSAEVVAYRSGDASVVATVDPNGFQPQTVTVPVHVEPLRVTGLEWSSQRDATASGWPDTLAVADSLDLGLELSDVQGISTKEVPLSWTSSDPAVVALDSSGHRGARFVARGRGSAVLTARLLGGSYDSIVVADTVRVMERWTSLSVGAHVSCAINTAQKAFCWGMNQYVGDGTIFQDTPSPLLLLSPRPVRQVSVGGHHACVLTDITWCWGGNELGIVGDGTLDAAPLPTVSTFGTGVDRVEAGGTFTCGSIFAVGTVCWGGSWAGQMGSQSSGPITQQCLNVYNPLYPSYGTAQQSDSTCVPTLGDPLQTSDGLWLTASTEMSLGAMHGCAVAEPDLTGPPGETGTNGYCWGLNDYGQLGVGGSFDVCNPLFGVPCLDEAAGIHGAHTWTRISAGNKHTCGIDNDSTAWCWGRNATGQLGATSGEVCTQYKSGLPDVPCSRSPVQVSGGLKFADITVGGLPSIWFGEDADGFTCGLIETGEAYCWGNNVGGQLGNGTKTNSTVPVAVAGGLLFSQIDAGYQAVCGITKGDGAIYCWGTPHLSFGNIAPSDVPARIVEPNPDS
jgi:alpha-tubulin suppressor-like RCC1 family protein